MNNNDNFINSVLATVKKYNMISNGDRIIAGLSGGADSVSLIKFLVSVKEKFNIKIYAVHVNHGIRGSEATYDEDFCTKLCKDLNIPINIYHENIPLIAKQMHISEEMAGRKIRYECFEKAANEFNANKIAVAHNKNDSVETILIKLARGSSLNGLKGILPVNGNVIRPLIETERKNIENYLAKCGALYVTDSTNKDERYVRNLVRNSIIPLFNKINPSFTDTVFKNSECIRDDDNLIDELSEKYNKIILKNNENDVVININELKLLHIALKRRILLRAVKMLKGNTLNIEKKHIDILIASLNLTGKEFNIGSNITAYISYDTLKLSLKGNKKNTVSFNQKILSSNSEITFFDNKIRIKLLQADYNTFMRYKNNLHSANDYTSVMFVNMDNFSFANDEIVVRNRRNGDKFIPSGMNGSKKLKDFFMDIKLGADERDYVPVLCVNGIIAAVIPYRVSNEFIVDKNTKNILMINFRRNL